MAGPKPAVLPTREALRAWYYEYQVRATDLSLRHWKVWTGEAKSSGAIVPIARRPRGMRKAALARGEGPKERLRVRFYAAGAGRPIGGR